MAFTFFFRDSQTLEIAIDNLIPSIIGQARIHVWDAGCAHGPEPFTIAIMLRERMSGMLFRNVFIHATDLDGKFEHNIRQGIFSETELKRIPLDIFHKYFTKADDSGYFQVVDELRDRVRFYHQDLLALQSIREDFSLIVCKNVLLHFNEQQRGNVLKMFHDSMRKDGLLVLEQTQKLPSESLDLFEQYVGYAQIFKRSSKPFNSVSTLTGPHQKYSKFHLPATF
jgi:chemotaxis protein methyltransferase CheR